MKLKLESGQAGKVGPSRVKWGQAGPNRTKWGKNRATGPNWAKWGQTGVIFSMQEYFYEIKIATKALSEKLAELLNFVDSKIFIMLHQKRGIFSCICQKNFFYHLKAYLYCFIVSHASKFLGAPFMVRN